LTFGEKRSARNSLGSDLLQPKTAFAAIPQEGPETVEPRTKQVLGHRLKKRTSRSIKHNCDCCSKLIWGMLQVWVLFRFLAQTEVPVASFTVACMLPALAAWLLFPVD